MGTERHNRGIVQPGEPVLDEEAYDQTLQDFRDEGLLWMVNTAILHPRGWALKVYATDGKNLGVYLEQLEGEYLHFSPGEPAADGESILDKWERSEKERSQRMSGER